MADRLFRDRGYPNVAIADIAAALSMSPANVFKHFRSKLDLVDEIVQRLIDSLASQIQLLDRSHPPRSRIRHLTHYLMQKHHDDFQQNPYIFELIQLTAERELQCGDFYRAVVSEFFMTIIKDATEDGIYYSANPLLDAHTMLQMFTGVLHPVALNTYGIEKLRMSCDPIVEILDRAFKNPLVK